MISERTAMWIAVVEPEPDLRQIQPFILSTHTHVRVSCLSGQCAASKSRAYGPTTQPRVKEARTSSQMSNEIVPVFRRTRLSSFIQLTTSID